MPQFSKLIIVYVAFVWLIAAVITVADKSAAKRNKWRVPEATLMLAALAGGALPMYITMKVIRHKTKHAKFMIGLPAIIVFQIAVIAALTYIRFQ